MVNIRELKKSANDKTPQGDVNIYHLNDAPNFPDAKDYTDPVLVYGDGGNHHKLSGGTYRVKKVSDSQFVVLVTKATKLTHEQHGTVSLGKGVYFIDRAREKGMFSDMINPVAD